MLTRATRKTTTQRSCGVSFSGDSIPDKILIHVLEGTLLEQWGGSGWPPVVPPTWPILWLCDMLDLIQKLSTKMVRGAAAYHVSREAERTEILQFLHFRGWHRANSTEFYSDSPCGQLTSVSSSNEPVFVKWNMMFSVQIHQENGRLVKQFAQRGCEISLHPWKYSLRNVCHTRHWTPQPP